MTSLELLNKFNNCADLRFKNNFGAELCSNVFLIPPSKLKLNVFDMKKGGDFDFDISKDIYD